MQKRGMNRTAMVLGKSAVLSFEQPIGSLLDHSVNATTLVLVGILVGVGVDGGTADGASSPSVLREESGGVALSELTSKQQPFKRDTA